MFMKKLGQVNLAILIGAFRNFRKCQLMTDSSVVTSSSSSIKPPIRKGTLTELCSQFTTTSCNEPDQNNSNLIKIQRPISKFGSLSTGVDIIGLDTVRDSQKVQTQQESWPIYDAESSYLKRLNFDEYITEKRTNDSIQRNNELKQVSQATHETETDENSNSSNDNKIQDRHTHVRSSVRCIPKGFIVLMIMCVLPISSQGGPVNQYKDNDTGCRATLSDSTPDDENYKQIECGITNCKTGLVVIFEKTEKDTPNQWTPVFEGSSKTQYRALETLTGYTLADRIGYTAFKTNHILHINTPIPLDEGKWRCVVYKDSTAKHISPKIEVNILVTPDDDNVIVTPTDSKLVTGQTERFTCTVDGVFPEPKIIWNVNGFEHYGKTTVNKNRDDDLLSLKNTIHLYFDMVGENVLACILLNKKRGILLQKQTRLEVKEPASVLYPRENTRITIEDPISFTLNCSGSGYWPHMVMQKDGLRIEDGDSKYTIMHDCNASICIGSITLDILDPCDKDNDYAGRYTCVISGATTYPSRQTSANMFVNVPQTHCAVKDREIDKLNIILIILLAELLLLTVGVLIWITHKKERYGTSHERIPMEPVDTNDNDTVGHSHHV